MILSIVNTQIFRPYPGACTQFCVQACLAKNSSENIGDGAGGGFQLPKVRIIYEPEGAYINQPSHPAGGRNLCGHNKLCYDY